LQRTLLAPGLVRLLAWLTLTPEQVLGLALPALGSLLLALVLALLLVSGHRLNACDRDST